MSIPFIVDCHHKQIHDVPEAYRPLKPTTVQISFFHIHRSCARWNRSWTLCPHQSFDVVQPTLYMDVLFWSFPSIFPHTIGFTSLLSCILQIWSNSLNFLFFIISNMTSSFDIRILISSFLIMSFQLIFRILSIAFHFQCGEISFAGFFKQSVFLRRRVVRWRHKLLQSWACSVLWTSFRSICASEMPLHQLPDLFSS